MCEPDALVSVYRNSKNREHVDTIRNSNPMSSKSVVHAISITSADDKLSTCNSSGNALLNLVDASAGAKVVFVTDEFFAVADNLIQPCAPSFDPHLYDEFGKVMDGWESRRRRTEGHDWCIIQLAYKGEIMGIEVDTAFFTGNHAPHISVQGVLLGDTTTVTHLWQRRSGGIKGTCATDEQVRLAEEQCRAAAAQWIEILPMTSLRPGYSDTRIHHFQSSTSTKHNTNSAVTHVRVNIFPDGGVARLKLWGKVSVDFYRDLKDKYLDVACASNGGKGMACSNQHYGEPDNLLKPTKGIDMRDGWETARHSNRPSIIRKHLISGLVDTDLMDWCILRLGAVVDYVDKLIIDTFSFKGNFPESCLVEGCYQPTNDLLICHSCHSSAGVIEDKNDLADVGWFPILIRTRLTAHAEHVFTYDEKQLHTTCGKKKVSHIRLSIYPDGGISRLRVFGTAREAIVVCPEPTKTMRSHL